MMHQHTTPDGKMIYYMSRAELERLPGYRGSRDTARSGCPIHGGDSHSAFQVDYRTGWGHCFKCGDAWGLRVEDHPDTKLPKDHPTYALTGRKPNTAPPTLESLQRDRVTQKQQTGPGRGLGSPQTRETGESTHTHAIDAQRRLQAQIPAAMDALPGSPGAAYLETRGIDLDTARALQIGWMPNYPRWNSAGTHQHPEPSIVLPYTGPDGEIVGATGRTIRPGETIRYYALPESRGYHPGLFNGRAVSQAMQSGHPLLIVEGPLDAAAAYAAGYPLTVGIGSTSYKRWDHFAGIERAILLLDNDPAGVKARSRAYASLVEYVPDVRVLTPAALQSVLEGEKDLGSYWQRYRRMPAILGGIIMGPHMQNCTKPYQKEPLPVSDIDDPMSSGKPHDLMQSGSAYAVELPTPYHRDLTGPVVLELFEILPMELQMEALALVEQLQRDRTFAQEFRADFYRNYGALDTADRVAVLWALIYHPIDVLARWKGMLRAA